MNDNYILHNGELYHWGVKGMRWGHKKGPKSKSKPKQKKQLTSEEKKAKGKQTAKTVLIGGLAGVTAAAITGYVALVKGSEWVLKSLEDIRSNARGW